MKKVVYVLIALLGVCIIFFAYGRIQASSTDIEVQRAGPEASLAMSDDFSVAAYNIAHARGAEKGTSNWSGDSKDKNSRSQAIGRHLAELDADIVVLNEVDFDATWSGRSDQAAIIACSWQLPFIARQLNFSFSLPGFSLSFGNAILSRYPIKTAERVPLPPLNKLEAILFGNHDVIRATIEVDDGTDLEVWGVHLEVRDSDTRITAIHEIIEKMNVRIPVVLAGDFNSQLPDDPAQVSAMTTLLNDDHLSPKLLACETEATFPTEAPKKRLDWIVFSPAVQLAECHLGDADYSDHLPIFARFNLRDGSAAGD